MLKLRNSLHIASNLIVLKPYEDTDLQLEGNSVKYVSIDCCLFEIIQSANGL